MASRVKFAGHERVFQGDSEDKKGDQANKFHSLFDTTDAMLRRSQSDFVCPVGGGGGGGWGLRYVSAAVKAMVFKQFTLG